MEPKTSNERPSIKPPLDSETGRGRVGTQPVSNEISRKIDAILGALSSLKASQNALEERLNAQLPARARIQQPARQRVIPATAIGRGGEKLSRRHDDSISAFDLPPEFVEITRNEGYDLEWKTESVYGQDRLTYQAKLQANGWRAVPNSRLPGIYAPEGEEGAVRHEGMVLMERPMSLVIEARDEERRKAMDQVRMKHESWGVETKNRAIFDPSTPMAKSYTIAPRATVEATDPSWQPTLEIAGGED